MKRASWGIVMTVDEPGLLVLTNVAWHLQTGAREIYVYFDDRHDPVADLLEDWPGVIVQRCDWPYWLSHGQEKARPPIHRTRQIMNANHALARAQSDWLFHIDADEFLYQTSDLGGELAAISALNCELLVPVWERVDGPQGCSIFEGAFRSPTTGHHGGMESDTVLSSIYGDGAQYLFRGVAGHAAGKCGAPVGSGFTLNLHWTARSDLAGHAPRWKSSSTQLLHFDGLTPRHWASKLQFKARYKKEEATYLPHRRAQMELVAGCAGDPERQAAAYETIKRLPLDVSQRLEALGLLTHIPFDPSAALAERFDEALDFSPEAFDTELSLRQRTRAAQDQAKRTKASDKSMAPS